MGKLQTAPRENTVAVHPQTLGGRITNAIGSRPSDTSFYDRSLINAVLEEKSRQTDKNFSKFSVIELRKTQLNRPINSKTVQENKQREVNFITEQRSQIQSEIDAQQIMLKEAQEVLEELRKKL